MEQSLIGMTHSAIGNPFQDTRPAKEKEYRAQRAKTLNNCSGAAEQPWIGRCPCSQCYMYAEPAQRLGEQCTMARGAS